jgi:FkbM family methyltransferase
MSRIRKILLYSLGEKRYLSLLANSFQTFYKTGRLGRDYQDIYFLKNLVRPGDVCVDIGAHLGYFTLEMSRLAGASGHVYAIEPMSKFFNTLKKMTENKGLKNITLYQYAMGGEAEWVEMGIPKVNNVKKFAYARVKQSATFLEYVESEQVKNVYGDELFRNLPKIDFIKCDVEGLELAVFRSFIKIIGKHQPIVLCELGDPQERSRLLELLHPFSYSLYYLEENKLRPLEADSETKPVSHNHYFIPATRTGQMESILRRSNQGLG